MWRLNTMEKLECLTKAMMRVESSQDTLEREKAVRWLRPGDSVSWLVAQMKLSPIT